MNEQDMQVIREALRSGLEEMAKVDSAIGRRAARELADLDNPDAVRPKRKPRAAARAEVVVINYMQDGRLVKTEVSAVAEASTEA